MPRGKAKAKPKAKPRGKAKPKAKARVRDPGIQKRFLYARSRLVAALALPRGSGHFPGDRESEVPREK